MRGPVLVVEDDADVAEAFELLLGAVGVEVLIVTDGPSAVERLREREIPLVITDWKLPGPLSGAALIQELKRVRPSTPIVVCSGDVRAVDEASASGAVEWLQKPFDSASLLEIIDDYL